MPLHRGPARCRVCGGGLDLTSRDLARFGEVMRLDGRYNGQPRALVDALVGLRMGSQKVVG